jgi:hypothetical protein
VTAKGKGKGRAKAERDFSQTRGITWLWAGILIAPLAFLIHLSINYALVTQLCQSPHKLSMHLVTILFLLIAAGGGFIAWLNWARLGRKWPGEGGNVRERSRFMAVVGFIISVLVIFSLIAQWIPQFIFDPCQR